MDKSYFNERKRELEQQFNSLLEKQNYPVFSGNGIFERYKNPVLTSAHAPLLWRYDLDQQKNPYLLERFGINAVFNAGAIRFNGKYILLARVEGSDRKSFFAVAESENGIDHFRFWDYPVVIPPTDEADTNVYDMRLIQHEDGWIYGLFCTERKDPAAPEGDTSSAVAQCGIVRTKDLLTWERLSDLQTKSAQQRNVVLHPEFVNGKYALYTRPQDSFIEAGKGGGIGLGFCDSMENAVITEEKVIDPKVYHTVYELKNGLGPAPIKTKKGWLHLAHGVRNTAAGLRYVLYMFMTDLKDIGKVINKPAGYFLAPEGEERVGDVSNVVFSNGWIDDEDGRVLIYYASSDTRMHVAVSSLDKLIDYCINTAPDTFYSAGSVQTIHDIIGKNRSLQQEDASQQLSKL
ncbi:MAG: glycosidase [Citrobacter freundii]|nr:MAG: glycosidase [Citrobacter freundii]